MNDSILNDSVLALHWLKFQHPEGACPSSHSLFPSCRPSIRCSLCPTSAKTPAVYTCSGPGRPPETQTCLNDGGTDRKVRGQLSETPPHTPTHTQTRLLRNRRQAGKPFTVRSKLTRSCTTSLERDPGKNNVHNFTGRKRLLNDVGLINSLCSLFRGKKTNL